MKEAEDMTLKVFTLPLYNPTPERLFRDYAYAASVFYSNPDYQDKVIEWCQEALQQSQSCKNTSGKQWVSAMLGSAYKKNGQLSKALKLFLQSKEEAQNKKDDLGVLNSLHALTDLFLYWRVPEYADLYATEAIKVEESLTIENPMVSAQTYINKGRAMLELGITDSVYFYSEKAREFCSSLPYNSGMVDVDLLHGIYLTEKGGDSMHLGIQELENVTQLGTAANRAKAYHLLAQTYLKCEQNYVAEIMLDSMYSFLNQGESPIYINIDYKPILDHYLESGNDRKTEQYVRLMLLEQQILKEKRLNYNLVEAIVDHQTEQKKQELKIAKLIQTTQRLWLTVCIILSVLSISLIVALLIYQRKQYNARMEQADKKLALLEQKLNQSNVEKAIIEREVGEMMNDKDNRQELTSLTPSLLKKNGESKFRQRFEVLYPLFLPRLRERVPSITRREELLSMLIVLKQDNKEIAELMAIAPRSVLMLRHRFRQKIGMTTDNSLEEFIEDTLGVEERPEKSSAESSDLQSDNA
jgi:DNA-binding CsgD family transcriptional regulator